MKYITILMILLSTGLFAKDKTIVLANETTWAPHYGKELKDGGYTTKIIKEALKKVGYKLEIKWLPWNRALTLASKGVYDGLGACFFNEKRAKSFSYTDTIGSTDTSFFSLKNREFKYTSMEDLKNYKIGTAIGYGYPKVFTDAGYLKTQSVKDAKTNVIKLAKKRIDLTIGSKKVIQNIINTSYPEYKDSIVAIEPAIDSLPLFVAFSKQKDGYEQKVRDFNRGLKMIIKDGTFDAIMKEYGFE